MSERLKLEGIGVSPGVAMAPAVVLEKRESGVFRLSLEPERVEAEVERFEGAVEASRDQLDVVKRSLQEQVGDHYAVIFDAQILMLEDALFSGEVLRRIREEQVNAEWALKETVSEIRDVFRELEDPYIRERVGDVEDLYDRVLRNLTGREPHDLSELSQDVIIVAHTLTPSDTASLNTERVVGFVTDVGGRTSHTAILARSLEVPAVIGLRTISREVESGDALILDGEQGVVWVNPEAGVSQEYRGRHLAELEREEAYRSSRDVPCVTRDGVEVDLRANIELPEEIVSTLEYGAQGIGLYRSEFLFLETSPELPTEQRHERTYRMLAQKLAPHPITVRTIDLGGEKYYHEVLEHDETNPVMGMRGIRLSLHRPDIFHTQLRGILRASTAGDLRLMFPLVSDLTELDEGRRRLEKAMEELAAEGVPFREDIPVGIMVEVPSAAVTADLLARGADFFSIGTNDLIQYTLAVDRGNESVSYLYQPLHPAVLRLIRRVVRAAAAEGIGVSVCGEMAATPLHALVLVGLGIRDLSMNPVAIPQVKQAIRNVEVTELEEVAGRLLEMDSSIEIERFLGETFRDRLQTDLGGDSLPPTSGDRREEGIGG